MNKQRKTRQEKGITLIALIITIVVLLILAVVAIRAVQDGGIINYAKKARDDYGKAQDEEQSMLQNYLNILDENNSNGSNDSVFASIKPENYGDTIEYSAGGVTDWKVFYKDDTNLYIIASDYLKNTNLPDKFVGKMSTYNSYGAYWEGTYSNVTDNKAVIRSEVASKYGLSWLENNSASLESNNIKAVADLLDEDAWTSKFGNTEKGIKAIGAPTLEMWIASWNAKGKALGEDKYVQLKTEYNATGYFVGPTTTESLSGAAEDWDDNKGGYYYDVGTGTDGYKDTLYFPYTTSTDDCCGYWLASQHAREGDNGPMFLYCDGRFSYLGSYGGSGEADYYYALRPIVSLPSDVIMTNVEGNLTVAK